MIYCHGDKSYPCLVGIGLKEKLVGILRNVLYTILKNFFKISGSEITAKIVNAGAPDYQKLWWGQTYVVGIICLS